MQKYARTQSAHHRYGRNKISVGDVENYSRTQLFYRNLVIEP